jgi:hypothetical protein
MKISLDLLSGRWTVGGKVRSREFSWELLQEPLGKMLVALSEVVAEVTRKV